MGKNAEVAGLMKDELGGKIVAEFVRIRKNAYSYLTDDGSHVQKAKRTNKCIIKRSLNFED